jgi:hypothetical protein
MKMHRAALARTVALGVALACQCAHAQAVLRTHIEWSVAHEGCEAYSGNNFKPVEELRKCFIKKEAGSPVATDLISHATAAELQEALKEGVELAYTEYHIPENFEWVLSHENQLGLFRDLEASKDYGRIRSIYRELQGHNPNAKNALSAISDKQIQGFLDAPRLTVAIDSEISYESLRNLDSLTSPTIIATELPTDLNSLMKHTYGFVGPNLTKLILEKNAQLSASGETDPNKIGIPPGTNVILPSIPPIGFVGTVPLKPFSGDSCPTCYTVDMEAIVAKAELRTRGDNKFEPEVLGHIETPAGQLQSVNAPVTAPAYGWYLDSLGVNAISPADLKLISTIPIGVVDGGVDTGHPNLTGSFWNTPSAVSDGRWTTGAIGYDFLRGNVDPWDEMPNSHGTHVSGLVVGEQIAEWNSTLAGILGHNLKLVELKVAGKHGTFDSATAQNAILAGIGKSIRLFNLSFELAAYSEMLQQYLMRDDLRGNLLFVIAAGNCGALNKETPGNCDLIDKGESLDNNPARHMTFRGSDSLPLKDVIFVAALDEHGNVAKFSNFGKATVEIAAPGSNISSTISNAGHGLLSGTSQAAPFVTLTAAILLAEIPSLSLPEVRQRIVDTCDWLTELKPYVRDGCRLNIQKAITSDTDLVQLKSGKILRGTVSQTQIPLPAAAAAPPGSKYERAWFDDDGQVTIATTGGRFKSPPISASSIKLELGANSDCVGQVTGTVCAIPVSLIRDVVFRVSIL